MTQHPKKSLLFTILFIFFAFSFARDTITLATPLTDNETLVSSSGLFALGFFNPPNSNNRYIGLWYNKISDHSIVWVANSVNPLVNSTGTLSITKDGRFTISNQTGIVWSSNTTTKLTNPIAQLLESGNLVVRQVGDSSANYAWQSFDYPTDTLIAGMRLGVDYTRGVNRTLRAWTSASDPTPGVYHSYMDTTGDPEIYFGDDKKRLWRTGPWDGNHFSGIPDTNTYKNFSFNFINNKSEVTYSYHMDDQSLVSKLVLTSSGYVQRALWLNDSNTWNYFWVVPKKQCDQIGTCGNYGLCDMNNSPVCNCLTGFVPKNPTNWNLRDGSDGCVRKTELDCVNGTDGFAVVHNVKLPQSENCGVDLSLTLDQCRQLCLKNCSCTAYASADINDNSGCVIWIRYLFDIRNYVDYGQTLYVRLAVIDLPKDPSSAVVPELGSSATSSTSPLLKDLPKGSKSQGKITVVVLVSLVTGVMLLSCAGYFLWRRKKRKVMKGVKNYFNYKSTEIVGEDGLDLPLVNFDVVAAATDNFSAGNKLGEGGFGPVYKGKFGADEEIAVKRLSKTSQQGVDEFKNEVMLIAKLQHINLVRLLGCCIQGEERMLIYEYMPNRSLDAFLFGRQESMLLDWKTRYSIIIGIARGLLYLHHDSRFRIIHRDLKASNILLDNNMHPKISDFGMARIFGGDEANFNTRKVVGTYGYMSPEYALEGTFSMKSDIFSFGVLVLEIISGKKNRGVYTFSPHLNLLAHAWCLWNETDSLQLVHETILNRAPTSEILKCIKISLLCVQECPEDRPLMSSVIEMFGCDIASLPEPNPPGFVTRFSPPDITEKQEPYSLNNMSITTLGGR